MGRIEFSTTTSQVRYKTVVMDRYDWLRCAAPCNNDSHGSGFEYLSNEPTLAILPEGTDLDGIYVWPRFVASAMSTAKMLRLVSLVLASLRPPAWV